MVRMTSYTYNVDLAGGVPKTVICYRSDLGFTDEDVILAIPRVGNAEGLYESIHSSYSFYDGTTNSFVCNTRLYSNTTVTGFPLTVIVLYRNKA